MFIGKHGITVVPDGRFIDTVIIGAEEGEWVSAVISNGTDEVFLPWAQVGANGSVRFDLSETLFVDENGNLIDGQYTLAVIDTDDVVLGADEFLVGAAPVDPTPVDPTVPVVPVNPTVPTMPVVPATPVTPVPVAGGTDINNDVVADDKTDRKLAYTGSEGVSEALTLASALLALGALITGVGVFLRRRKLS